jgi:hypothetical protein
MSFRVFVAVSVLALGACSAQPYNRSFTLSTENQELRSTGFVMDARQRVAFAHDIDSSQSPSGQIRPHQIVCAEPSPDVAVALAEAFSLGLSASAPNLGQAGLSLGAASAESLAELGRRTATVQLMRDLLYRACESYANGAISATGYAVMLSSIDKFAATLFLAEAAAGTTGGSGAIIRAGAVSAEGNVDLEYTLNADILPAGTPEPDATKNMPAPETAKSTSTPADTQNDAATDDPTTTGGAETEMTKSVETDATSKVGKTEGAAGSVQAQAVAEQIARMHESYMTDRGWGAISVACMAAMDRRVMNLTTKGSFLTESAVKKVHRLQAPQGGKTPKSVEELSVHHYPISDISAEENGASDYGEPELVYSMPAAAVETPLIRFCRLYMPQLADSEIALRNHSEDPGNDASRTSQPE